MKHISVIVISLLLITSIDQTKAQEVSQEKLGISLLPQYAFIGGIRADVDLRIKDSRSWLVLSPQVYINRNDDLWGFNFDRMNGLGLIVSHRHYTFGESKPEGVYLQYGLTYNYTHIMSWGQGWSETEFGNSPAITSTNMLLDDKVHKLGANFLFGIEVMPYENLQIDFYSGIGYRNSFITLNESGNQSINGGMLHPAYTGFVLLAGIRLGVFF